MGDNPRVLVLWYSQTGQLRRAAEAMVAPLAEAGWDIVWEKLAPREEFPFPWSLGEFLTVFPESVTGKGCELEPPRARPDERFDLIVFAYTVWYLSPSLPTQGFFTSPLRPVMRDTPVVTLVACRNMWFSAEARLRRLIRDAGGRHVATVAATDDGPAWATFVTTPRWLLTGKTDRFLRFFPPPGIGADTIASLRRFGDAILTRRHLIGGPTETALLNDLEPLSVDRPMVVPDIVIGKAFRPWGRALSALGRPESLPRQLGLAVFATWLVSTVLTVVPLFAIARLFLRSRAERATDRYLHRLQPGVTT